MVVKLNELEDLINDITHEQIPKVIYVSLHDRHST